MLDVARDALYTLSTRGLMAANAVALQCRNHRRRRVLPAGSTTEI